jgi:endo-1,4-beta-xylanase
LNVAFGAHSTLKEVFKDDFLIGTALNVGQFYENEVQDVDIIKAQFNSITPENILKWESVHPLPNEYAFEASDQFIKFGEENKMFIIGHTLIWHQQTPKWVFEDDEGNTIDRDTLLERMRSHIHTVVGRYKGKIHGWDVVNEAVNNDGTMLESPWMKIIGEDYVMKAFQFAHEADPNAELYYNDYGLACESKRAGAIALIRKLQANGIPMTAIGLQEHNTLEWPPIQQVEDTIISFAELGLQVHITELDVDVLPTAWQYQNTELSTEIFNSLNPYSEELPASIDQALTKRYTELFEMYLKHHQVIDRVTLWGVTDRNSWLNYIPIKGRTNYPLLFDRNGHSKQAFDAVISLKKQ